MKLRCSGYAILALLLAAGHVQAQKWYTLDVAREVGIVPCGKADCILGRGDEKPIKIGAGQITAVTMFYFDTTATHVQGRIVDIATGKPIKGATIQTSYTCWEGCDVKTAAANEAGFFRLGWVGCHGLKSSTANRPLLIKAAGYQPITTEAVRFGGGAYLHIELAALPKGR
ncbi:carboxypeptidase-like regulatory domain-containing protein [Hymenobacter convexus]|uniref:carboxypeptidase-like regulatory domain-containing protein n=1 Tax=Hymenobacter sp. CA1UV-4 TaxID=3063782 RepID=UPI00272AD13F|nr:carboxypeptidase-like regulatory domain-containing protein [Hymenobacter sp. CA1UV-4]